jgi:hypothetical protein
MVFVDESGDLEFSAAGTRFFLFTALAVDHPVPSLQSISDFKHTLWLQGHSIEYFHANNDSPQVRKGFLNLCVPFFGSFKVYSIIVQKNKTYPGLFADKAKFYRKVFEILMEYIIRGNTTNHQDICIVTDSIPLNRKRREIEKAFQQSLRLWKLKYNGRYSLIHVASKSEYYLQIADYVGWAVFRKWERADLGSYSLIRPFLTTEFDVFSSGNKTFY